MTPQSPSTLATQCEQISLPYEELFHLLIDQMPTAIALLDSQMRYLKVSQRWLSDYGLSEQDIIGKSHCEVFEEDSEHWQEIYSRCQTGAVERWQEELPEFKPGTINWINWEVRPWCLRAKQEQSQQENASSEKTATDLPIHRENLGGLLVYAERVTSCRPVNVRSRRQIEREHLVRSIAARIHQSLTLDEILQTTVDEVRQVLKTDRVLIYRFNSNWTGSVAVESVASSWKKVLGTTATDHCFGEKYVHAYQNGRVQAVADIEVAGLQPCHIDFLKQFQVRANLIVPIIQGENLWGLLCAHECQAPRDWQQVEVNLLKQLATHVAIAIQQSSLYAQLEQELTERKAAEIALQQSKARFQKLSAHVPGMIYQFRRNTDGSISFPFVSPSCYEIYELPSEVIQQDATSIIDCIHPDDRQSFEDSLSLSAQTLQPWHWEGRITTPSGQLKWLQGASRPELQANGEILWDGLVMDVTARKIAEVELQIAKQELESRVQQRTAQLSRAIEQQKCEIIERKKVEAELRESQLRLSLLFQQTQLAVIEWSPNFEVIDWNPAAEKIFGYSRTEALGNHANGLIVPKGEFEQSNRVKVIDQLIAIGGNRSTNENITKDGKIIVCDWYTTPLIDSNGALVGFASLGLDITERARAIKALRENEERYRTVVEKASDGIFLVDVGTLHILEANAACCLSLGYTREEILNLTLYEIFAVESKKVDRFIQRILRERRNFQKEGKHLHKNGSVIDAEISANLISYGGTEVFCFIFRDVTERRQAELILRQQQEFLQKVIDTVPSWIFVKDWEGKFVMANQALADVYGTSPADLIGKKDADFNPNSEEVEQYLREDREVMTTLQEQFIPEESVTNRSGKVFWAQTVKRPLLSADGTARYALIAVTDITPRKHVEEALRQSEIQLRQQVQREKLLNCLTNHIRNSLDFDTILERAVQEIQQLLQIDHTHFAWYHSEAAEPYWEVVKEARNPALPDGTGHYLASKIGSLSEKILRQEMLRVDDVEKANDLVWQQFIRSLGFASVLVMPMQSLKGALGAIICSHSEVRPWCDGEVEMLQLVMAQLAIALNQAELYTQSLSKAEELARSLHKLKATQAQLVQTEKISSLGQLVAGVAHEVNNPVSFLSGNLHYAIQYASDLLSHLRLYQQHFPDPPANIQEHAEDIDLEFLALDLPKMLSSMVVGTDRIRDIMLSLRNFSRVDEAGAKQFNIYEGLDSTLMILQHRLKKQPSRPTIQVVKEYCDLPLVECYPGQLNQVFMNILANAIDAFDEYNEHRTYTEIEQNPNVIQIRTSVLDECRVAIRIKDNGPGIQQELIPQLFDPFFTTKPMGKGTGLGLSISYQIVTEIHNGQLKCHSELGKGTEFIIEIPINLA